MSVCLQCGRPGFQPWVGKIPRRRKWQSTPVLVHGKSHGQRRLAGYSLCSYKESDMTEWLHFHFITSKVLFFLSVHLILPTIHFKKIMGFQDGLDSKESAGKPGDMGYIPGLWRSPAEGNDYSLQYSCQENPTDRGAWRATFYRVTKSRTQLSNYHYYFYKVIDGRS